MSDDILPVAGTRNRYANEKALAKGVVEMLKADGWEVFQEVNPKHGLPVCDIVARRGSILWAIECKMSLNFCVIGQAAYWRERAHRVSIVTHWVRRKNAEQLGVETLLKPTGIGWIEVSPQDGYDYDARKVVSQVCHPLERIAPTFRRINPFNSVGQYLCEEQKDWAEAGGKGGGYFTPFQKTCATVRRVVTQFPGIRIKELLERVEEHHYSSDASFCRSISEWAERGQIKGVRLHRTKHSLRFYPNEQATIPAPTVPQESIIADKDTGALAVVASNGTRTDLGEFDRDPLIKSALELFRSEITGGNGNGRGDEQGQPGAATKGPFRPSKVSNGEHDPGTAGLHELRHGADRRKGKGARRNARKPRRRDKAA